MNNKWELFQKFLITQEQQISIYDFVLNSAVIIILAILLELTYIKCARTISNRKQFAGVFLLIAFTTMLIISIVKSSLALSLGLVGALSIVRFRAAIKEPEELVYLFFAIAIGLGLGANQTIIVIVAFVIAMIIIWTRYLIKLKQTRSQNLFMTFSSAAVDTDFDELLSVVKEVFGNYQLRRYDINTDRLEASFLIDSAKAENLNAFRKQTEKFGKSVKISFVENKSF